MVSQKKNREATRDAHQYTKNSVTCLKSKHSKSDAIGPTSLDLNIVSVLKTCKNLEGTCHLLFFLLCDVLRQSACQVLNSLSTYVLFYYSIKICMYVRWLHAYPIPFSTSIFCLWFQLWYPPPLFSISIFLH